MSALRQREAARPGDMFRPAAHTPASGASACGRAATGSGVAASVTLGPITQGPQPPGPAEHLAALLTAGFEAVVGKTLAALDVLLSIVASGMPDALGILLTGGIG